MEKTINKDVESFSTEWWNNFLDQSENFTKTNVFNDVISKEDVDLLNKEVMKILQEIYSHKTNQYGFRVYLEGKEQDNTFMAKLFESPPYENESIKDYTNRLFLDQKFGMIINRTEKFSEKMAHEILLKIQPLLDKAGIPLTGLSAHILIGNYGWTPLGIHQDSRGDNVIHFHLGPGPKVMYNWEEEKYKKLTEKQTNNKDIEPLLPFADKYPFETGDLYFMPWNKYHIGFSDELSVGLTIWFNNPTKKTFASKILDSIRIQYLNDDKNILNPDNNSTLDSTFMDVESVLNLNENLKQLSFIDLMKHLHKEYKLAIVSNGGWSNIPITLKDKIQYDVDKFEVLENKKITTPYPFKTFYEIEKEELVVFARGYKLNIIPNSSLLLIN